MDNKRQALIATICGARWEHLTLAPKIIQDMAAAQVNLLETVEALNRTYLLPPIIIETEIDQSAALFDISLRYSLGDKEPCMRPTLPPEPKILVTGDLFYQNDQILLGLHNPVKHVSGNACYDAETGNWSATACKGNEELERSSVSTDLNSMLVRVLTLVP